MEFLSLSQLKVILKAKEDYMMLKKIDLMQMGKMTKMIQEFQELRPVHLNQSLLLHLLQISMEEI